jgi:hypothetical protein
LASEKAEEAAIKSAKSWLSLVDQGKYAESWDAAAKLFRGAIEKDAWENALKGAREPLGATVSRNEMSATYKTSLPGAPDGEYVVIQFNTSFENKKKAIETITPMKESDGSWKVSGYYIK